MEVNTSGLSSKATIMSHDHGQATRKLQDSFSLLVKWAESSCGAIPTTPPMLPLRLGHVLLPNLYLAEVRLPISLVIGLGI